MNEVSCQMLDVFFQRARRERLAVERLMTGIPLPVRHLTNKNNRIDWDVFRTFMGNAGRIWSRDELIDIGESFFSSPALRTMSLFSRFLFTGRDFYKWVFEKQQGAGDRGFTCFDNSYAELEQNVVALELRLKPGFAPCPEFFLVALGNFRGMPRALGLGSATVQMTELPDGARYLVNVPPGGGLLPKLRRTVTQPFSAVAVARALRATNHDLETRNEELSQTRTALADKTERLEVVNRLGRELARHTHLDGLAGALSQIFAESLPGLGVAVYLLEERDGGERLLCRTGSTSGTPSRHHTLISGDEQVGRLEAYGAPERLDHPLALLEDLVPWVSIALGNARSFTLLGEYRDQLSLKVDERTSELNRTLHELEQSLTREREAMRLRTEFFDNVSHELRTPLTLILLTLDSLQTQVAGMPAAAQQHLDRVQRSAGRLLRLINDLLDLAKLEAGKMRLRYTAVDLPELLDGVLIPFRVQAEHKGLKLRIAAEPTDRIHADPERLDMVFQNLIGNALKFTTNGEVSVRVWQDAFFVHAEVADTGPGIHPDDIKKLFQRFAQADAEGTRRFGGTGIGLALAREVVELHEGTVHVESALGTGSRFRVSLPRGTAHVKEALRDHRPDDRQWMELRAREALAVPLPAAASHAGAREAAHPPLPPLPPADAPTVMIVEDDPEIRLFLVQLLEPRYHVLSAENGADGLELARTRRPALIVSDVMMPVMSGVTLLQHLRQSVETADIPVILLTARQEIDARVSGLEQGASDYLAKPFAPRELLARVETQLRLRDAAARVAQTERLAATSLITSGFAHEVRNPLNGLINALAPLRESMGEGADPELAVAMLDVVEESVHRIRHLAESLLAMVRTAPGKHPLDVTTTVRSAVRSLEWKLTENVRVEHEHAVDKPVYGDPGALTQVWINLIDNALRAVGPTGRIRVVTRCEDADVVVQVSDDGCGMSPEAVARAFEPFFTTRVSGEGTGLGLPLCRRIVLQHQGRIELQSSPGVGTTVTVRIPAVATA